ncbi:MAG: hypothetical protein IT307_07385 [Chloroflexi bacterium]|nr:hypothetical protein [Chloroflexota bacterium]
MRRRLYEPLLKHLASLRTHREVLTFDQLELLLGRRLPPSARRYVAWWSNTPDRSRHCYAWLEAGWRVEDVRLDLQTVAFTRD